MNLSNRILASLALFAMLLATTPLFAGEKIDTKGTWALQFGIESQTRLTSFQGTALSLQKTTMGGAIWRMGLGLNFYVQDRESEYSDEDSSFITSTEENNNTSMSITIQRLFKLSSSTRIQPYVGIGPLVNFSHQKTEQSAPAYPLIKKTRDSWSIGARSVFGAECFITSYLSLLGEYSFDASFNWTKDERVATYDVLGEVETNTSETKTNSFRVSSGYTHLAVSLYF